MNFKKNDILTLEIEDITNLGFGVAKKDGAVIFVADTVPQDTVRVKIIKAASSYFVGRAEEFISLSPLRECSRCSVEGCKSCAYRKLSYTEECRIKTETVRQAFIKAGLPNSAVLPTVPSPVISEYRNKAQYPVSQDKDGRYKIGFYAPKSHTVCEAANCPLSPKVFSEIIEVLREFFKAYEIPAYDEKNGKGLIRHIYLRRAQVTEQILLTIVINGNTVPYSKELCELLTSRFPSICGILLNVNEKDTNVILGDKYSTLWGQNFITDTLAGVRLKISAPSFYQVNHATATLIYEKARELAALSKNDTLLDLYCGTGSIGLSMARDAKELIGIEIVEDAVRCAKENADAGDIENAHFFTGDASECEHLLDKAESALGRKITPDVIILDPPRAGCDKRLLNYVSSLSPKRIVYISCNPTTLARDLKAMSDLGFSHSEITPYDMFPMTGHVESVVCLSRK